MMYSNEAIIFSKLLFKPVGAEMENKILSEIQNIINENKYMNGKATAANTIGIPEYVIYFSESGVKHIKNRHQDKYAPGSLFNEGLNYIDAAKKVSSASPEREDGPYGTKVKWIGIDTGSDIGYMGVAHGDPEDVAKMKDYVMPDSKNMEKVKVSGGERSSTKKASLITVVVGKLSDNRELLSVISMFPGGADIDGNIIPSDRSKFAAEGFYFVLPEDSPALS